MPKLYLADFTYFKSDLNTSGKRFAIIDGKQRLSAIFKYFDNELSLPPDFVLRSDPDVPIAGLRYSELNELYPDLRLKVDNFNLPVMSVISDELEMVNELFVRLNSGKPLTAAERRNAMNGIVPELVRGIASSTFFSKCVKFSNRGRAHDQAAAKLLLLEASARPVDLKKRQLDELFRSGLSGDDNDGYLASSADTVMETLNVMVDIFDERDPLLSTQGQMPVYYLVFRGANTQPPNREALESFDNLRTEVRGLDRLEGSTWNMSREVGRWELDALIKYNRLMRNPNDAHSVYLMAEIMSDFIASYL